MKKLIPLIALLLSCGGSDSEVNPLVGEWTFVSLNDENLIGSVAHHFGSRDLAIKSIRDMPTSIEDYVIRFNADLTYTDSYGAFGTWSATDSVATLSEGYDVFRMPYVITDSELVLTLGKVEMLAFLYGGVGEDEMSEIFSFYLTTMPYIHRSVIQLTLRRQVSGVRAMGPA
jgi:hypothetical protein